MLRAALAPFGAKTDWHLLLGVHPLSDRWLDAVLLAGHASVVMCFRADADRGTREAAQEQAFALWDFHPASRRHAVVPILVAPGETGRRVIPCMTLPHVAGLLLASPDTLPSLLQEILRPMPHAAVRSAPVAWGSAPLRRGTKLIDAARLIVLGHGLPARADLPGPERCRDAVLRAVAQARQGRRHIVVFVTGVPGGGRTVCGMDIAWGDGTRHGAEFFSANPAIIAVLNAALGRQALRPLDPSPGAAPGGKLVVIDDAQRLTRAPGALLDAMARRDWAVLLCLVGSGQEIASDEIGLGGWGAALRLRPGWTVHAAPGVLAAPETRQRLFHLDGLRLDPALHLTLPLRAIPAPDTAAWVDAVLRGERDEACALAQVAGVPFRVTRRLDAMRAELGVLRRGTQRAGLLASAGAGRRGASLRAEDGIAGDGAAIAHWFLADRPDDILASSALRVPASEACCQGLELDHAGLCWGGDLIRAANGSGWAARAPEGAGWTRLIGRAASSRLNAYRVLLTRARAGTIIWVPRGRAADSAHRLGELDSVAEFLLGCGAAKLGDEMEPDRRDAEG